MLIEGYLNGRTNEDFSTAAADAIADLLHAVGQRSGMSEAHRVIERAEGYYLTEVVEDE
jgi:hypothetical protein